MLQKNKWYFNNSTWLKILLCKSRIINPIQLTMLTTPLVYNRKNLRLRLRLYLLKASMYGTDDLFIINNNRCSLLLGHKSITSTNRFSFQIELFSVLIRHLSKMWHKPTQNFITGHLHLILLVNGLMIRMWILLLIKTIVF